MKSITSPKYLCALFVCCIQLWAKTPLIEGGDARVAPAAIGLRDTADAALSLGLPEADELIERLLQSENLSEAERLDLNIERIALAIQLNNWGRAERVLKGIPADGPKLSLRMLLEAMIYWGKRDFFNADAVFARVDPRGLSDRWSAWYWLLQGMLFEVQQELGKSAESFNQAFEYAQDSQLAFLELLIERNRMLSGNGLPREGLETELMTNIREFSGQAIAHQYAEQLLIFYINQNAFAEAQALIDERRAYLLLPRDKEYADRFTLMEALLLEAQGKSNVRALVGLLGAGSTPRTLRIGLEMLMAQRDEVSDDIDLGSLLMRWAEALPAHPIRIGILHSLALYAFVEGDVASARSAALRVIEDYPGSEKVYDASKTLAWAEWQDERYRAAAAWFEKARSLGRQVREEARISSLIADAYFLAEDYDLAAANYARALEKSQAAREDMRVWEYQRILSLLRSGSIDAAQAALDSPQDWWTSEGDELRWRLEWNLAVAMSEKGAGRDAQQRIARIIRRDSLSEAMALRFRWLNVRLLFDLEEFASVVELVDTDFSLSNPSSELTVDVYAELALIKARSKIRMDGVVDAVIDELKDLRKKFPDTEAAPQTLWIAGRALASEGDLVEAEELMNQLATEYPKTQWSRIALFESASLAEAREDYQQAANRLEEFIQQAPEDPMVFAARLNQADLLRKTGSFDDARVLLESMLLDFPEHPDRFFAEMIRADLLAAEGGELRLADAASAYLKILDLPNIPDDLTLEAMYKLGKIYERQGNVSDAYAQWLLAARQFEELSRVDLTTGPYWVSRGLFEVARISEEGQNFEAAIATLKKISALGLPGKAASAAALQRLRSPLVGINAVTQ